ncbi:glycosyltransferase family 2 protein [Kocuria salina]|uniref:glycosyltransferase family 2 protein n=1 Tax=Kocuria salina TaxID=1929416 RepID=UPI00159315DD|nr:glycosyltransferase family 2 protein [Kocuria salina]NVC24687.1 glycosyltransferase family 2 protein [Kocuria salina]
MFRIPVTAMVLTKNEEAGLARCLKQLQDFAEVVVVDSHSEDRTVDIARDHGATVVEFTWNGRYPKKKQWMLENVPARHDWVLYIDADETPTSDLVEEIRVLFLGSDRPEAAFDIPLDYVFAGKVLRHGHTVVKRALVHRTRVHFPEVGDLDAPGIGEVEGHYQPKPTTPDGITRKLQGRLRHEDHDPIRTWFDRHNKYSDWEAHLRIRPATRLRTRQARSIQGQVFERVPFKPAAFFLYSYILRRGFADGRAGFDYALALSMYYWQIDLKVRELKGWQR